MRSLKMFNKIWFKQTASYSIAIYFILTLPLAIAFGVSHKIRFIYFEVLAGQLARTRNLKYVFIGDSMTRGGENWGWKLEKNPFISKNLGVNGNTTKQIAVQVKEALNYHPDYIFILAGTNDAHSSKIGVEETISEYRQLLDKFKTHSSTPVITLVPFQGKEYVAANNKVEKINRELEIIARQQNIATINLNPVLAPDNYLLPQYTYDGVHFTEQAYEVWREKINDLLS